MYGYQREMEDEFFGRYDAIQEAYAETATGLYDESESAFYDEINALRTAKERGELVLTLETIHVEEFYNHGVKATIPPCWKALVCEEINYLFDDGDFISRNVEGIGRTEQEAIEMLVGQLQSLGLHGKLRRA